MSVSVFVFVLVTMDVMVDVTVAVGLAQPHVKAGHAVTTVEGVGATEAGAAFRFDTLEAGQPGESVLYLLDCRFLWLRNVRGAYVV